MFVFFPLYALLNVPLNVHYFFLHSIFICLRVVSVFFNLPLPNFRGTEVLSNLIMKNTFVKFAVFD